MIIEVSKDNISLLDKEFISKKNIRKDLENNPFGKVLAYIENEEVVGYLYYSDIYDRAEINQIEVLETHRSCGKASKLIKKMLELVEKSITLEVNKNNIPAINLYKKFNFKEQALRKGYYNGEDAILMERKTTD